LLIDEKLKAKHINITPQIEQGSVIRYQVCLIIIIIIIFIF